MRSEDQKPTPPERPAPPAPKEEDAEPVSHAQAVEMGKEWKGPPDPVVEARLKGTPVPGPAAITGATDTTGVPQNPDLGPHTV